MPGIDIHTHLAPDLGGERLDVGPAALHYPDELLAYLDAAGLDEAVVSVPPPFYRQHLDADESRRWVRALNDGLAKATAISDRLRPLAYLPLEHPTVALTEYQRIRHDAFVGITAAAGGDSVVLSSTELRALWYAMDSDAAMLLLHPGHASDERLASYYLSNLLGNPAETAVAVAHLVFGDVLAAYPRMRIVLVHCGGTVPALIGRWQRGVDTARPGLAPLTEPPEKAVRRLYVDCLAHAPGVVDLAVDVFGADRILLGSDWPFPMGTDDPAALIAHRGEEFVHRAGVTNARTALGLNR